MIHDYMGLIDTIEKIQNKPEPTRYKILIVSVIVAMALIIGLWQTLPDRGRLESLDIAGPFKLLWENAKTTIPFGAEDLNIWWQNLKTLIPNN